MAVFTLSLKNQVYLQQVFGPFLIAVNMVFYVVWT